MVVCVRYSGVLCVSLVVYDLFPSCYLFKQPMAVEVSSVPFDFHLCKFQRVPFSELVPVENIPVKGIVSVPRHSCVSSVEACPLPIVTHFIPPAS